MLFFFFKKKERKQEQILFREFCGNKWFQMTS